MNGEKNWTTEKREWQKLSYEKLQAKLQELQKDRLQLETNMISKVGTSVTVRNYPSERTPGFGNLNKLKRSIAYVNQLLHQRSR
jgi:ribosomal protein L29